MPDCDYIVTVIEAVCYWQGKDAVNRDRSAQTCSTHLDNDAEAIQGRKDSLPIKDIRTTG